MFALPIFLVLFDQKRNGKHVKLYIYFFFYHAVRRSTRIKKAGTNAITVLALRTAAAIQVRISISTAVANISIRTAMKSTGPTHIPPTNI